MTDATTPDAIEAMSPLKGLLHGMAYRTPVVGTIKIGSAEHINGLTIPVADDQITVYTRFRDGEGNWVKHAVMGGLQADKNNLINDKLRRIPVRVIYDNPNLNVGEQYAAFTKDGRQACVGNGAKAKQIGLNGGINEVSCPGPENCAFGGESEHRCDTFTRAMFHIDGQDSSEGAFIFRTSSYNSVNDIRFRLQTLHAGFGRKLAGLPMWLTMRLKSTPMSQDRTFFYTSLEPRFATMKDGILAVKAHANEETEAGFDRAAYETAVAQLLANGSFNESAEDMLEFEDLLAARKGSSSPAATHGAGGRVKREAPDLSEITQAYATKPANDAGPAEHGASGQASTA